ncbi:redoxin domain-containing protein [Candidatus Woesearchaeota archaeon]|nr:redoxin domain-containing protein [Candidatus Woesearchaeota archaeon]
MKKIIITVVVIVAIVGAILVLESSKTREQVPQDVAMIGENQNVVLPEESAPFIPSRVQDKEKQYQNYVELVSPEGYINTEAITIGENIGKNIVLVDFWTYSCINCQRTLPYLNAWWEKYEADGLVIIGVHTPEFAFEEEYENVKRAVDKYGVEYPVVQDNDKQTWRAYKNRYWPHKYLIDIDGFIVYDHIGEGGYEETEQKIQELLRERNSVLKLNAVLEEGVTQPNASLPDFGQIGTPEIYFGYEFQRSQMGNTEGWKPEKLQTYALPSSLKDDLFYLEGDWFNHNDNMELTGNQGKIIIKYTAKNVNLVAGAAKPMTLTILKDGQLVNTMIVKDFDLYPLIQDETYGTHELTIELSEPGLMAYTFTFG